MLAPLPRLPGWAGPAPGLPRPRIGAACCGETGSCPGHCLVCAACGTSGSWSCRHLGPSSGPSVVALSPACRCTGPFMKALLSSCTLSPRSCPLSPPCSPQLRRPSSPGWRGEGHGHHPAPPGPGPSAPEGLWVGRGRVPGLAGPAPALVAMSPARLSWPFSPHRSLFLEVDPRHPELVGSWLQSQPGLSLELVAMRRDFCGR